DTSSRDRFPDITGANVYNVQAQVPDPANPGQTKTATCVRTQHDGASGKANPVPVHITLRGPPGLSTQVAVSIATSAGGKTHKAIVSLSPDDIYEYRGQPGQTDAEKANAVYQVSGFNEDGTAQATPAARVVTFGLSADAKSWFASSVVYVYGIETTKQLDELKLVVWGEEKMEWKANPISAQDHHHKDPKLQDAEYPPIKRWCITDEQPVNVVKCDLNINTDDKPRDGNGMPIASRPDDITDADRPKKESLGGYTWINDDNDHDTGGTDIVIDSDDTADYEDDDLEPLKYEVSQSVWDVGGTVELEIDNALKDSIRIWQANKNHLVAFSGSPYMASFSSADAFDFDKDGILYIEALKDLRYGDSGMITLRVKIGGVIIAKEKVKLTIFYPAITRWKSNYSGNEQTYLLDDIAPPTGQTRGGQRVFPDHIAPTDTTNRDQPVITTQFLPSIPNGSGWHLPLYGVIFDVSHYSTDTTFHDISSSRDPEGHRNGHAPNDNRTGYTGTDDEQGRFGQSGDTYDISIEVANGADTTVVLRNNSPTTVTWGECVGALVPNVPFAVSKAYFHITHPVPGNNWRAAVGCGASIRRAIQISSNANDGETIEYINHTALGNIVRDPTTYSRQTDTLTVWRKLYLERDFMGPVNLRQGPADLWSLLDGNVTAGAGTTTLTTDITVSGPDNRLENGAIQFWQRVDTDPAHDIQLGIGTITANDKGKLTLSSAAPAKTNYVYLTDDNAQNLRVVNRAPAADSRVSPAIPDMTLFNQADMLPAACIEANTAALSSFDTANAPFLLHSAAREATINAGNNAVGGATKGIRGGILFWVATIVEAYQSTPESSGDPNSSGYRRGRSNPYWGATVPPQSCGSCVIYTETIRDFTANLPVSTTDVYTMRRQRTTLHECGHLLGGRHTDGGLMAGGTGTDPSSGSFSGTSLRRFMLLRAQGPSIP
ncbi:MAG: hypothetical protein V1899_07405, partial [Planctomycetota bacterium]